MPIWIFRVSAVTGFPLLVYIFISKDEYSIFLSILCGLILVAAEYFVRSLKFVSIMIALFGALCGFMIYVLCDYTVFKMNVSDISLYWEDYKSVFAGVVTVLGGFLSIIKAPELEGLAKKGGHLKVLDLSALVDGRIVDLCETGFLSGVFVIPQFVLDKLNALASARDQLEKARGRRGLDVITRLKELKAIPVRMTTKSAPGENDTEKLVRLAKDIEAKIVTIDFNVNKEAAVYDVTVLNISDLTTALKPVVLPGESMSLFIMKEGKEKEQGIGYLDDGTMVVVEDGLKWIGKRAEVSVYSLLQTSAGRITFAKIKRD